MSPMDAIVQFVTFSGYTGVDIERHEISPFIPYGWQELLEELYRFRELSRCQITSVTVEKGLLRVRGVCSHPTDQLLFNRLSQSFALGSCNRCLVCRRYGWRRKTEDGWPVLCQAHYVEYINFINP
jgi:hypothetical protein